MLLNKVTLTGIDRWTNINDLINLQLQYPAVEFGVLVSATNVSERFCDLETIKRFCNKGLNLSMHVCGRLVKQILVNDFTEFNQGYGGLLSNFKRMQLNTHSIKHKYSTDIVFPDNIQVILQLDGANSEFFNCYIDKANVVGLNDMSGGNGILPDSWEKSEMAYTGFAGGISPDNVVEVVKQLESIQDKHYWIDMETHIRTNERLDLNKCELVLKQIYQH